MKLNQGTAEEYNTEINNTHAEINGMIDSLDIDTTKAKAIKDALNSSQLLMEMIEKIGQLDITPSIAKCIKEKLHYLDALNNPYEL